MNLVTGATGHIGNVLVRELIRQERPVRALVLPREDRACLDGLPVEICEGDVLDPGSLDAAMQGVDTVYHLAGIISIMPGQDDFVRRVNVDGTKNVLRAAQQAGVRRLVYTSSIHAFGRPSEEVTIDERLPFDPQNTCGAYDRTKAEASLAVLDAAHNGLDAVVVCPTGVVGPHDYRTSELGQLVLDWLKTRVAFLIDGAYDFVDVRDVVEGEILAADRGATGESYILSGERISLPGLFRIVREIAGLRPDMVTLPTNLARFAASFTPLYYRMSGEKPRFTSYSIETVLSNSNISSQKAREALGYHPRSMTESMRDTVAWWKNRLRTQKKPV